MKKILKIAILLTTLTGHRIYGQDQNSPNRFGMEIEMGFSLSQLKADGYVGLNKVGLAPSLTGNVILSGSHHLALSLGYDRLGSAPSLSLAAPQDYIDLQYLHVALLYRYSDWKESTYSKLDFETGISYARLVASDITSDSLAPWADALSEVDFRLQFGLRYFFSDHHGIGLAYHTSLTPLLPRDITNTATHVRGSYLSIQYIARL